MDSMRLAHNYNCSSDEGVEKRVTQVLGSEEIDSIAI